MPLTLQPITRHFAGRFYREDPTPGITPRPVADTTEAEQVAARLLGAHGSISHLQLLDGDRVVNTYSRSDFLTRPAAS